MSDACKALGTPVTEVMYLFTMRSGRGNFTYSVIGMLGLMTDYRKATRSTLNTKTT